MARRLLVLSGLAAIGAVVHHAITWVLTAMVWWADRYRPVTVPNFDSVGGVTFYLVRAIDQLSIVAVPAFLLVSGYFIAFATDRKDGTLKFSLALGRIGRLLPPYILWSLVIILLGVLQGAEYSLARIGRLLLAGGATGPFYYIPLIVALYLLAPLAVRLVRYDWKLALTLTAAAQLLVLCQRYIRLLPITAFDLNQRFVFLGDWHLGEQAVWFVLGIVVGFRLPGLKRWLARVARPLPWLWLGSLVLSLVEWEALRRHMRREWISPQITMSDKLFILTSVLTYLAFENLRYPFAQRLAAIGGHSFGVYLLHVPVLEVAERGIYHLAPHLLAYPGLFLVVIVACGLGGPLTVMAIVRRSPGRVLYQYMFG